MTLVASTSCVWGLRLPPVPLTAGAVGGQLLREPWRALSSICHSRPGPQPARSFCPCHEPQCQALLWRGRWGLPCSAVPCPIASAGAGCPPTPTELQCAPPWLGQLGFPRKREAPGVAFQPLINMNATKRRGGRGPAPPAECFPVPRPGAWLCPCPCVGMAGSQGSQPRAHLPGRASVSLH